MTGEKVPTLPKVRTKLIKHGHPEWMVETEYLADVMKDMQGIIGKDASIFQPGCGCGYVLDALWEVGYTNLTGLDKNKGDVGDDWNPEIKFIHSTIGNLVDCDNNFRSEDVINSLPQYDVVFTHRFLHIWPDEKDWLFKKIANKANKFLITLEGEEGSRTAFWTHLPRNYQSVFEKFGFKQIFSEVNVFPFQNNEIITMTLRVFKRNEVNFQQ